MNKLLLWLFLASACFAQQDTNKLKVIPAANGSAVGEVQFQNKANTHHVGLASPDVTTADHTFRLPAADTSGGGFVVTDGAYNLNVTPVTGIAMPTVLLTAGCDPTGATDSSACLNAAFAAAAGAAIRVPSSGAGFYAIGSKVTIPANVYVLCDVGTTLFKRTGSIASGFGWFDIPDGTGVAIDGCTFEGQTTTPAGIDRANIVSSALISTSSTFTDNSTIWVHGGSLTFKNSTVQHSGGYPLILDARAASIDNVFLSNLTFQFNRSFLFGSPGDETYGSWQGGVFVVTANVTSGGSCTVFAPCVFGVHNLKLIDSTFRQNTGHAFFMDARNGNTLPNANIKISGNTFKTIGLDAVELSGVSGFDVSRNSGDHIGFVSTSDSDLVGTAKWYNGPSGNVPAVAFDHASLVMRGSIANNTVRFLNGGGVDGDGLGGAKIIGNDFSNPLIGDADYDATVAGQMGPAVYGGITAAGQNWIYGYNAGNTNGNAQAENNLSLLDNLFSGIGCSIKLYGARNVLVSGNTLTLPGNSNATSDHNFCSPITLGTVGTGTNQQATKVTVTKNKITYSGGAGINAVTEDPQYGAFTSAAVNSVYDNDIPGSMAAFLKDSNTSSVEYGANSTTSSGITSAGHNLGIAQSGSTSIATFRNQMELGTGIVLSRFYYGATPQTTTNLILSLASNGRTYLGNGSTTGGLYWGASPLIDETQDSWFHSLNIVGHLAIDNARNSYLNSVTDVATNTLTLDSSRNSRVNSVSVGTGAVAQTAAGLAIANDRTAYLAQVFVGTNGASPVKAIDASNNHTGFGFYGGNSITGAVQFLATATTGTGCTTLLPCINMGNISNLVQSNAASTVSFAAPVGFGGNINASALGALVGAGSLICLDGSAFVRSGCPGATAPLLLGSNTFTGSQPFIAIGKGANDNTNDYSPVVGLLGTSATSTHACTEYIHTVAANSLVREGAGVFCAVAEFPDYAWETDAVIGMAISKSPSPYTGGSRGSGGSVAGSFMAVAAATSAVAWSTNLLVQDWTDDGNKAGTNYAATLIGTEMDLHSANPGSSISGLNIGLSLFPNTGIGQSRTSWASIPAISVNLEGTPGSSTNYFDYAFKSVSEAAKTGLYLGKVNFTVGTGSQFIDMVSSSPSGGSFTTRMFVGGGVNSTTSGSLVFSVDTFTNGNFIRFDRLGNIQVDGTAAQASISTTRGYMQAGEGFYTTSSAYNAFNSPNGGANLGGVVLAGPANTDIDAGNKLELIGVSTPGCSFFGICGNVYMVLKNNVGLESYMGMTGGFGGGAFFGTYSPISMGIRTNNTDRIIIDSAGNTTIGSSANTLSVPGYSTFGQAATFNSGIILGGGIQTPGGHSGYTGTINTRNSGGTGICTLDFSAGVFYGSSGC